MGTFAKFALGLMGQLRPRPARGDAIPSVPLPKPERHGGMPLMDALAMRQSAREFESRELPAELLSSLLWAAFGVNRPDGHRTAPTAINSQEIDVFVALPTGAYLYDADTHSLQLTAGSDIRRITGYQDFVESAPLTGIRCRL